MLALSVVVDMSGNTLRGFCVVFAATDSSSSSLRLGNGFRDLMKHTRRLKGLFDDDEDEDEDEEDAETSPQTCSWAYTSVQCVGL